MEPSFAGCFPRRPTFLTGVAVFGVAAFLPLRVLFALGVATTGDTTASFTGLATFFGEAAFLPPFLTGVAAFGVAAFLPLRVVFALGVATTGDTTASFTGLATFFGEAAFLPPFLTSVAAFGVAAFFPLRVAFSFGVSIGVGMDSFTGLSTLAFFAGETALTGVLAPRFPRGTFLVGDAGFGVAVFLPLRATDDGTDSFTGLSTFAFLAGEDAFTGDLPRLPRVALGVAVFAGLETFGWPLVALPLPFAGVAAFGVDALGLPLVDRPVVVLVGVKDFSTTGAATGDSGLGVSTFGFPRVDRPFAFGVTVFLTGDAFLGFPLVERDAAAFGEDSTSAGGDATATGDVVFFPNPLRPFGVTGLAGDDTTFLPLVAFPLTGVALAGTGVATFGVLTFFPLAIFLMDFTGEGDFAFGPGEGDAFLFAAFFVLGVFAFGVETFGLAISCCIPSISGDWGCLGVFINSLTPVNFGDFVAFGVFSSFRTPRTSGDFAAFGVFISFRTPRTSGDFAAFGVFIRLRTPRTSGDLEDFGLFMSSRTPKIFGDAAAFGVFKSFLIPLTFGDFGAFGVFNSSRKPDNLGVLGDFARFGDANILFTPVKPSDFLDLRCPEADSGDTSISPGPSGVGGRSE